MIEDLMFEEKLIHDSDFRCYQLSATPDPCRLMYQAMHQDYSSGIVALEESKPITEKKYSEIIVRRCLKFGHYGIAEHPSITLNFGNYPHSVMQQARTHRTGLCLSGDSLVRFGHPSLSYGEKQAEISIGHLADLWFNGGPHQRTDADAAYMRRQIKSRWVHVYDTKEDKLVLSHISNIYRNGEKPVLRINTDSHGSIKATKDHRFYTNQGWKSIKDFNDDTLLATYHFSGNIKRESKEVEFTEDELLTEEWVECKGYPYYEVSSLGRVRSYMPRGGRHRNTKRKETPSLKKLCKGTYLFTSLSTMPGGKQSRVNVHTLVANSFYPFYGRGGDEVCHINGNKFDNRLSNLVYGSSKRNSDDLKLVNEQAANRVKFVEFSVYDDHEVLETFDIEVEHHEHNFIANGFVTHNSFDVQSFRYTGQAILDDLDPLIYLREDIPDELVEKYIYLRPVGWYVARDGKHYHYTEELRKVDLIEARRALVIYCSKVMNGMAEEHARGALPFDYRQHFVVTMNLRTALHFLDMRFKKDAQLEIRAMSFQLHNYLTRWVPGIMPWYEKTRMGKNKLSP